MTENYQDDTLRIFSLNANRPLAEKIAAFPKFSAKQSSGETIVIEASPKENRVLATISETESDTFTIETALERKYKVKLEVIPLIEAYAHTAISKR